MRFDPVAQLVEQYTFNVWALGSNPSGITKTSAKAGVFVVKTWGEKFIPSEEQVEGSPSGITESLGESRDFLRLNPGARSLSRATKETREAPAGSPKT